MVEPETLHLEDFEAESKVQVSVQQIAWDRAWDELLRFALYGEGPDISEIGSTWLSSLIDMNALRPLTSWDLNFLRNQEKFFPAARWAIMRPGDHQIWAIPMFTDTRAIYYRRDWLNQAGVKESTAFETFLSLSDTLERLQASGAEIPWAMPTRGLDTVYDAASWVWESGGRFRTKDGRHLRLHEPEARAGLRTYFALHRFLKPPARDLETTGTDLLFREGRAAAVLSGPWLLGLLSQDGALSPDIGVAPVPGIPFVGGTHLVIWGHARDERTCINLMQHLTSAEIQRGFYQQTGLLPSRMDVLNAEPFVSDPRYQAFARSLEKGRVLTVSYRWAAVEQRLVNALGQLWSDLATDPQLDLEVEIERRIMKLSEDLEQTILATW